MATIDLSTDIGKVRMAIADVIDPVVFSDAVIQQGLTNNNNDVNLTIKQFASYMLGQLSLNTDERLDKLQFYGSQKFAQYLKYLTTVVNSTNSALNTTVAQPYFSGVDKEDVVANKCDPTVVHIPEPLKRHGLYSWDYYQRGYTFGEE